MSATERHLGPVLARLGWETGTAPPGQPRAVVAAVLDALDALGALPADDATAAPHRPDQVEEVARWLRDLADHPRFTDRPRGVGWEALIGQEGNVLMAARLAMANAGQAHAEEIVAARDVLLRVARENRV